MLIASALSAVDISSGGFAITTLKVAIVKVGATNVAILSGSVKTRATSVSTWVLVKIGVVTVRTGVVVIVEGGGDVC